MEQMREECTSNYLSRWFCGMDPECRMNDRQVLEAAKVNMRDKYAFVGLTAQVGSALLPSGDVLARSRCLNFLCFRDVTLKTNFR